jgi:hypothetical protein
MRQSLDPISLIPDSTAHLVPRVLALGTAITLALVLALPTYAERPTPGHVWPMIGHDVRNTRSQPFEWRIGPGNAARLAPKWVLTTAGDVSATPTVSSAEDADATDASHHRRRGQNGRAVYFPDWVVFDRCNSSGLVADAGHEAAARVRGAARAAADGVVDVPQALHGSPSAPPINAQRVARFGPYHARNCLPPQKLRQEIQ